MRIGPAVLSCSLSWLLALILVTAPPASAETLSLDRAVALALAANPDLKAVAAAEAEARERRTAAGAAWFPRVDIQEGWQRGNQPVFVFGSLLAQRRFAEANFAVSSLNRPDALDNFRTAVTLSQTLFDGGRTSAATRSGDAAALLASASSRQAAADIVVAVAETYGRIVVAEATVKVASSAIEAATEDLARARARRDAGLATDADVLSFEVHAAQVRAQQIVSSADAEIARATLNLLLGSPLDRRWELVEPGPDTVGGGVDVAAAESTALRERPDLAQARFRLDLARAEALAARAALLPRISLEGGYEWNGGTWADRESAWVMGVQVQLSLNARGAEGATAAAARHAVERALAEQASAVAAARLDLRTAAARLEAARAQQNVARATVAQARETQRIVRDRYDAGAGSVTEVLRAAHAVLDAEALDVTARVDAQVASAALQRALGRPPVTAP